MYVTLEEAKEYLRIDHDAEDETVSYLLASAERLCLDVLRNENPPKTETLRMGILFSVAYFMSTGRRPIIGNWFSSCAPCFSVSERNCSDENRKAG